MQLNNHTCTKEEFYVLAKTKTEEPNKEDLLICEISAKTGEVFIPGRDFPAQTPLVEMEGGEVLASTITESPAPAVAPEPKKSWKKAKAAK